MKRYFHSELDTLKSHLLLMGEKANDAVKKAVKGLTIKDLDLAREVIAGDDEIDALEIEIDHEATRYLTLRSPVATDLRLITVAIKASHDLERVGDEARNIAKRTRKMLVKGGTPGELHDIPKMAELARQMLYDALECFFNESPDKAYQVLKDDEMVDDLNKANIKTFIKEAKTDPDDLNRYMELIFISKSLERIADHATNLAEEVIFLTTAQDTRHQHQD
jgi:phosphate transport system protein